MYCSPPEIRRAMNTFFREDELTRHCYFGDGSPFPTPTWRRSARPTAGRGLLPLAEGDVMMIDNMLAAHARNAFTGPREILAALGEVVTSGRSKAGGPMTLRGEGFRLSPQQRRAWLLSRPRRPSARGAW